MPLCEKKLAKTDTTFHANEHSLCVKPQMAKDYSAMYMGDSLQVYLYDKKKGKAGKRIGISLPESVLKITEQGSSEQRKIEYVPCFYFGISTNLLNNYF